jgi:hypothetical protein
MNDSNYLCIQIFGSKKKKKKKNTETARNTEWSHPARSRSGSSKESLLLLSQKKKIARRCGKNSHGDSMREATS